MADLRLDKEGHPIVDNLDQVDDYLEKRNKDMNSGALVSGKSGTITVDHAAAADALIRFIDSIPNLDPWIKRVMIMRIGNPLLKGKKMTHLAIALELGMDVQEVIDMEKAGVAIANKWMETVTADEIIQRGQKDGNKTSLIKDTFNRMVKKK